MNQKTDSGLLMEYFEESKKKKGNLPPFSEWKKNRESAQQCESQNETSNDGFIRKTLMLLIKTNLFHSVIENVISIENADEYSLRHRIYYLRELNDWVNRLKTDDETKKPVLELIANATNFIGERYNTMLAYAHVADEEKAKPYKPQKMHRRSIKKPATMSRRDKLEIKRYVVKSEDGEHKIEMFFRTHSLHEHPSEIISVIFIDGKKSEKNIGWAIEPLMWNTDKCRAIVNDPSFSENDIQTNISINKCLDEITKVFYDVAKSHVNSEEARIGFVLRYIAEAKKITTKHKNNIVPLTDMLETQNNNDESSMKSTLVTRSNCLRYFKEFISESQLPDEYGIVTSTNWMLFDNWLRNYNRNGRTLKNNTIINIKSNVKTLIENYCRVNGKAIPEWLRNGAKPNADENALWKNSAK